MITNRRLSTVLATALASAGGTGTALAQTGAAGTLEEVVVTARRYAESISDAPLAVAVMDDGFLQAQGAQNLQDVIELTPGATWGEFTKAQPSFSIRGINGPNFGNSSLESAVQVVTDGLPMTKAFMLSGSVFDLERIEIMRGPQGTTFGRNATLGLMHLITARPTQEFGAGLNLSLGAPDMHNVDGFVTGALTDTISGRLAFNVDETDGAMEDYLTGRALEQTANTSIRGSLLIEPNDNFTAFLKAEFSRDDDLPVVRGGEMCNVEYTNPGLYVDPWFEPCDQWKTGQSTSHAGGFWTKRDINVLMADLRWTLSNDLTLTSVTGLMSGDHHTFQDTNGTPLDIGWQEVKNDGDIFSTEIRLDNHASGDSLRWVVGAYFLEDEEFRSEDGIGCPQGNNCGRIATRAESHRISISNTETTSYAVFGELSFDLSDQWNLTVGGRFTDDTRDYTYAVDGWGRAGALANIGIVSVGTGPGGSDLGQPERDCANPANRFLDANGDTVCGTEANPMGFDPVGVSSTWDNFSGKISLAYAVTDNTNLYVLYSEGFKGGGFQHDARNVLDVTTRLVDSETAENFEIGWKGSFDRARFALTWFQMEQINAQNNALIPVGGTDGATTTNVVNFGGIENDGLEFEGTVLLGDNFTLGGSVALYNGILGPGSVISASEDAQGNITGEDVSGQRPSASPEETWAVYGEYEFGLQNGSSVMLRADLQHRGDIWRRLPNRDRTLISDPSKPRYLNDPLDNIGVRVTWLSADGDTSVSLWGRNLNNDLDYKSIGPPSGNWNQTASARAKIGRKQFGIDANFLF